MFGLLVKVLDLRQKPRIDCRQPMNLVQVQTNPEGVSNIPETFRARLAECHLDFFAVDAAFIEAVNAAKPREAKGQYIRSVTLTTTMGPGIHLDLQQALGMKH